MVKLCRKYSKIRPKVSTKIVNIIFSFKNGADYTDVL